MTKPATRTEEIIASIPAPDLRTTKPATVHTAAMPISLVIGAIADADVLRALRKWFGRQVHHLHCDLDVENDAFERACLTDELYEFYRARKAVKARLRELSDD